VQNDAFLYYCVQISITEIFSTMEIPDIKKQLSILTVLEHYNIKPDKHSQINCPFHQDDKPSCKVYPETNTFHCFGCGATGDQIEFIQKMEKCDKHTALKKAAELAGGAAQNTGTAMLGNSTCRAAKEETSFEALFAKQKEGLPRSPKAQAYLKSRGLENLKEVGYNSGTKWNKLKHCIIFPLKDNAGNITSLYGRRITEAKGYPCCRTIVS
jgi:DNA primase